MLQKRNQVVEDSVDIHQRFSTSASVACVSGNQKVISMPRYNSMPMDSSTRACFSCPIWL
jgi:hypothetical protein